MCYTWYVGDGLLQTFEPLFPAVTFHCQLCGKQISQSKAVTKRTMTDCGVGEFLFCEDCSPKIAEIEKALFSLEMQMRGDFETSLAKAKTDLAADMLGRAIVQHEAAGTSAPPSDERTSPRSSRSRAPRQGQIPNPKAN